MTLFQRKPLGGAGTLGERLHHLRTEAGLTIENVASTTGIQVKHLQSLESGRYQDLPGEVYARNFVRRYARLLEVREQTALLLFEQEYAVVSKIAPSPPTAPMQPVRSGELLTPQGIRRTIILLIALGILVYLGTEITRLTAAPRLTVISPLEQVTTQQRSIELRGITEPETTVTANGRAMLVNRQGSFQELLDLHDGLNTIVIRAEKKRGGSTTVIRNILVETP